MNKRALTIAAVSTVVASFLLFLWLRRFELDTSGGDRIRLLVTVKPVARNAAITEDMLTEREVPVAYVEDRAVKRAEKAKILGLRVGTPLLANQTLMWTDLAIANDEKRDLSSLVQPGSRAVTVRALGETSKSGALMTPGDYVDIVLTIPMDQSAQPQLQSIVLMQRVLVLAIGLETQSDSRAQGGTDVTSSISKGGKYSRDLMLTLSINLQEAQLLSVAQQKGKLSVALRNPDDQKVVDDLPDMSSTTITQRGVRVEPVARGKAAVGGPVKLDKAGRLERRVRRLLSVASSFVDPPRHRRPARGPRSKDR